MRENSGNASRNQRNSPLWLSLASNPVLQSSTLIAIIICILPAVTIVAQSSSQAKNQAPLSASSPLSLAETQTLIKRVLATELAATQDGSHPMRYQIHKQSPRLATTKQIIETKDGDVAHLVAINDAPLSAADQTTEESRLQSLLANPGLQRHRQEREQGDTDRARKIIRALPDAFLYSFAGTVETPQGLNYRMTFQPNPDFDPHNIEAQALKAMAGELWIDIAHQRVTRLEGKRLHDVDYGWGMIGKLDQGGTLLLEQADIGGQWRTTRMVLEMNARVLFKSIKLDTTLELSGFEPVPPTLDYRQAIQLLETDAPPAISSAPAHPKKTK